MKRILYLVTILLLTGCSSMPYQQWNGHFVDLEEQLRYQKGKSAELSVDDIDLFKGAYNASTQKNSAPYPELKAVAGVLMDDNSFVTEKSEIALAKLDKFRKTYGEKPMKSIGPEWDDYQNTLAILNKQVEANKIKLVTIEQADVKFDSICLANKIKAVPLLDYEAKLAQEMATLENRFADLNNKYAGFKRKITERADQRTSMNAMNGMKQKIRQIEAEILQLSNLYSRLNSMRSDSMLYEGPYIKTTAEVGLITTKVNKINGLVNELEDQVRSY